MDTTPAIEMVDITSRPGGVDLVVLEIRHDDGRLQQVGIGACAAYGLCDDLQRTLAVPMGGDDEDDWALWDDDPPL